MIIAGKYEVPDECPSNCPDYGKPFGMESICFRCPIMNCAVVFDEEGNDMAPIRPEDFDAESAESWFEFFQELKK